MKSLKSIICSALDEQEVQGKPKIRVNKISEDAYGIQIIVQEEYSDDIDEMALYDVISDSEYGEFEISIDIISEQSDSEKIDYAFNLSDSYFDEDNTSADKSDEELAAEEDDLHVFNPEEDEDNIEDLDDEDYADLMDDDSDYAYLVTWEDVSDFEKEFGDNE